MADVFVPSDVLGPLIASTIQSHVAQAKLHCPDHCSECQAVAWLRDNAPAMASTAVQRTGIPSDWQWQRGDGTIDWASVTTMFTSQEECLHDQHRSDDNPGGPSPQPAS